MKHNTNRENVGALIRQGVPYNAFMRANQQLEIEDCATRIKMMVGQTLKSISPAKQVDGFNKLLAQPLRKPLLYVISSFPSDQVAKAAALFLFQAAYDQYEKKKKAGNATVRGRPQWISITGSYERDWLNKTKVNPAFIVVSNVPETSTPHKLEKARDLLEVYSDRPRVLVTSAQDPLSFCSERLQISANGMLWLGPPDKSIGL